MKTIEQVRNDIALTTEQKRMLRHAFSIINKIQGQGVRFVYANELEEIYAYNAEKWELVDHSWQTRNEYDNAIPAQLPLQHLCKLSDKMDIMASFELDNIDLDWRFDERKG